MKENKTMKRIAASNLKNKSLIIGSIVLSLLFHLDIFFFLTNTTILDLKAFEEAVHAHFDIGAASTERMKLERLYKEYDNPEKVPILKETPTQILKDIPYSELDILNPSPPDEVFQEETKEGMAAKLAESVNDDTKKILQKEMLDEVTSLSHDSTKLFKEIEETTLSEKTVDQVQISEGKKVAIKEIKIFSDHHNLADKHYSNVKKGFVGNKPQKINIKNDITVASISKTPSKTDKIKISKIDVKHEIKPMAPKVGPSIIQKDRPYESFSSDVDVKFTTYRKPGRDDVFFKITLTPREDSTLPIVPKDVLFVVDVSGSIYESEIDDVKSVLLNSHNLVNKNDKFNVIAFSATSEQLFSGFQEVNKGNIGAAISFIDYVNLNTTNYLTDVYNVLTKIVSKVPITGRPCNIFFISDGKPTTGIKNIKNIVEDLRLVRHSNISIFPMDIGGNGNKYLLDLLAFESRGVTWIESDAEKGKASLEKFILRYKDPLLLNLEVSYSNLDEGEIYPKILPNLYKGRNIEIFGISKVNKEVAVRVIGKTASLGQYSKEGGIVKELFILKTIPIQGNGGPEIARELARRKIHYLVSQIAGKGRKEEWILEIDDLRREYSINIPYKIIYGKYWFVKMFKWW